MSRINHSKLGATLVAALFAMARGAHAQGVTPESSLAAQALFDEAKRLMQDGDAAAACPKFEESERLEQGIGTKLNLATCYERIDRTASAWILYLEVESETRRNGQTARETLAHEHAAALSEKLSRVTIDVPATSRITGLTVERDGIRLGSAQWGLSVPVDPGIHTVRAYAGLKTMWQVDLKVPLGPSTQTLSVPVLADVLAPITSPAREAKMTTETPRNDARQTAAYVAFGVSGAAAALGTVFGLRAISKNNLSNEAANCRGDSCLTNGVRLRNEARLAGNVSSTVFAISGAALATGLVLVLLDLKKDSPRVARLSAGAASAPSGAQLMLRGAW